MFALFDCLLWGDDYAFPAGLANGQHLMVSIFIPEMTTRKKMPLQGEVPSSKLTLLKQAVTFIAPRANTALDPWWNHDTMAAPIFSLNVSQTIEQSCWIERGYHFILFKDSHKPHSPVWRWQKGSPFFSCTAHRSILSHTILDSSELQQ